MVLSFRKQEAVISGNLTIRKPGTVHTLIFKNMNSDTIAGMIIFSVFIIWAVILMIKRRDKESTSRKADEETDEFDPSQIF